VLGFDGYIYHKAAYAKYPSYSSVVAPKLNWLEIHFALIAGFLPQLQFASFLSPLNLVKFIIKLRQH